MITNSKFNCNILLQLAQHPFFLVVMNVNNNMVNQTLSIYQVTTDFIMYFVNTVQKSRCHAYCKKFLFVLMDTSIIIQIFVIMPKKKEKGIEHFFDI